VTARADAHHGVQQIDSAQKSCVGSAHVHTTEAIVSVLALVEPETWIPVYVRVVLRRADEHSIFIGLDLVAYHCCLHDVARLHRVLFSLRVQQIGKVGKGTVPSHDNQIGVSSSRREYEIRNRRSCAWPATTVGATTLPDIACLSLSSCRLPLPRFDSEASRRSATPPNQQSAWARLYQSHIQGSSKRCPNQGRRLAPDPKASF